MSRRRRSSYYDFGYHSYPSTEPREVVGGIKSQGRTGRGAANWWAKRWLAILEGFQIGTRLTRGRSYAKRGQVISITIDKGAATAEVQGSRTDPYRVTIAVKQIPDAGWRKVIEGLSGQALFTAKLLAGHMPEDIETAFAVAKLSLLPEKLKDISTNCSCPDWSTPCKHVAAVYYLLGEEFDRDPFLIFRLRGMDREQLMAALDPSETPTKTTKGARAGKGRKGSGAIAVPAEVVAEAQPELTSEDASGFWSLDALPEDFFGKVCRLEDAAPLVKSMGDFPFWRASQPFMATMEKSYTNASRRGLELFLGTMGSSNEGNL